MIYPVMHADNCLTRAGGPCNCHCTVFDPISEFADLTSRQKEAIIHLEFLARQTAEQQGGTNGK